MKQAIKLIIILLRERAHPECASDLGMQLAIVVLVSVPRHNPDGNVRLIPQGTAASPQEETSHTGGNNKQAV